MPYYLAPRFLDKLALHLTKNFLDLPGVAVPLLLGIHGRKGEGKTFQCKLALERMGVEAVHMSGGELESPDAGDPARLIRLRYRETSDRVKVRGRMCALVINDLDAGAGRFDRLTQYTVNTQLVNATLMNIADNPTNVQLPGSYDSEPTRRVPIIVTGNDFGTLYAPLIRDGRMDKFYWEPSPEERLQIVMGIFADSDLSAGAVENLVRTFPDRAIDFFGAMKSRAYDGVVRQFIETIGIDNVSQYLARDRNKQGHAETTIAQPRLTLDSLLEVGQELASEQDRVQRLHLAQAYNPQRSPSHAGASQGRSRSWTVAELSERDPGDRPANPSHATDSPTALYTNGRYGEVSPQGSSSIEPGIDRASFPVNGLTPSERSLLASMASNGCQLGIEYADTRHFRVNSWQCFGTISPEQAGEAGDRLEACLQQYPNHYVRLVAIDRAKRQRLREEIVRRPLTQLFN